MHTSQQNAFTLVEMLTCLMLAALLTALALPLYQSMIHANKSKSVQDSLRAGLHLARTHSVNSRLKVELCGSSDGNTCNNAWNTGWLIREQSSGTILRSESLNTNEQLVWKGFSKPVRFIPSGHSNASNGTFTYCDEKSNATWQLVLNRQGRTRLVLADSIKAMPCDG